MKIVKRDGGYRAELFINNDGNFSRARLTTHNHEEFRLFGKAGNHAHDKARRELGFWLEDDEEYVRQKAQRFLKLLDEIQRELEDREFDKRL